MGRSGMCAVVAFTMVALAPACADDESGASADGGLVSGAGFSVAEALAELPVPAPEDDGVGLLEARVVDLDGAAEATSTDRGGDDHDAQRDWLVSLTTVDSAALYLPVPSLLDGRRPGDSAEIEDELGWSIPDVSAAASVAHPPWAFTLVTGDVGASSFDGGRLAELGDGLVTAGEGDDLAPAGDPTAARPSRTPLRMAADGDTIAASTSTASIREWEDGTGEAFADLPAVADVAEQLDAAEVVAAMVFAPLPGGDGLPDDGIAPPGPESVATGLGWSVVGGDARMTVVHAFEDPTAATAAVAAIEEGYAGVDERADLVVDDVEVAGATVVVTLHPGHDGQPATLHELVLTRELPGMPAAG